jgi:hypothetical protein
VDVVQDRVLHLRLHAPAQSFDLGDDGVLGRLEVLLDLRLLLAGGQHGARVERVALGDRHRVAGHLQDHRHGPRRIRERGNEASVHAVQRDLLELQPEVGRVVLFLGGGGDRGDCGGGERGGGEAALGVSWHTSRDGGRRSGDERVWGARFGAVRSRDDAGAGVSASASRRCRRRIDGVMTEEFAPDRWDPHRSPVALSLGEPVGHHQQHRRVVRMGHSTARAALIYQRARRDREREIAATVSARVEEARRKRAT